MIAVAVIAVVIIIASRQPGPSVPVASAPAPIVASPEPESSETLSDGGIAGESDESESSDDDATQAAADAGALYQETEEIEARLADAASAINADLGSGSTVSDETINTCHALLADAQGTLSEAQGNTDERASLLVAVLENQVVRAQALVDGSEAARDGGDFKSYFQTGRDAKKAEGWVYVNESQWDLDPDGDLAKMREAFGGADVD